MTELNTYSNAVGTRPITWADIVHARDEMRKVSRVEPRPVNPSQYWVCRRGEWIREQDDFGFGIFERYEDPENWPYNWKVDRSGGIGTLLDFVATYLTLPWVPRPEHNDG